MSGGGSRMHRIADLLDRVLTDPRVSGEALDGYAAVLEDAAKKFATEAERRMEQPNG